MKWNMLFVRGRRDRPESLQQQEGLTKGDAVHNTTSKCRSSAEHPSMIDVRSDHRHADDRTEASHTTSCSNSNNSIFVDSPRAHNSVPQHIVHDHYYHDCSSSVLESPRSELLVQFSTVEMRHYQRIVGDHPDVEIPLAIGWDFVQGAPVSMNDFEGEKAARDKESECDIFPFATTHGPESTHSGTNVLQLAAALALTDPKRAGLLPQTPASLEAQQHKNSTDLTNKYLEPISLKERIFLLRTVGGYSLKEINLAERRRRVQIVLEWTYR
jgi:hypothetical protein